MYFPEINFVRGWACLAVVTVHVAGAFYYQQGASWSEISFMLNQLGRFGTPLFAVIGGFLLFHQAMHRRFSLMMFIRSRTMKILLPFLIWSGIYLLILWRFYEVPVFSDGLALVLRIITGQSYYHLYFMVVVLQFYLLFPLLQKNLRSERAWRVAMLVSLAVTAGWLLFPLNFEISKALGHPAMLGKWIFYFLFGGFLARHWNRIKEELCRYPLQVAGLTIAVFIGGIVEYQWWGPYSSQRLMNLVNIPILFLALVTVHPWFTRTVPHLEKGLQRIGTFGFGIYLVHPLWISLFMEWIPAKYWHIGMIPFIWTAILSASVIMILLIRRTPFHPYLLTIPKHPTHKTQQKPIPSVAARS